jgi:Ras-related protein Rab-11A
MTDFDDVDMITKAIILGESSVGKSNLLIRFTEDRFEENAKNTIGIDLKYKVVTVDGKNIKVQFYDTAGQERFRALTPTSFHKVDMAVIVYDLTRRETFDQLPFWIDMIRSHCNPYVRIMIIGNKLDIDDQRLVSLHEGVLLAKTCGAFFFETSAKTNLNDTVQKAFMAIIEKTVKSILADQKNQSIEIPQCKNKKSKSISFDSDTKYSLKRSDNKRKHGCCSDK